MNRHSGTPLADMTANELRAEVERLREAGNHLEHALDQIDCAVMSAAEIAEDTKAVGGPVSAYSVSYDEQGVVERVKAEVKRLEAENDILRSDASPETIAALSARENS